MYASLRAGEPGEANLVLALLPDDPIGYFVQIAIDVGVQERE
jgi:hypothetical protein